MACAALPRRSLGISPRNPSPHLRRPKVREELVELAVDQLVLERDLEHHL